MRRRNGTFGNCPVCFPGGVPPSRNDFSHTSYTVTVTVTVTITGTDTYSNSRSNSNSNTDPGTATKASTSSSSNPSAYQGSEYRLRGNSNRTPASAGRFWSQPGRAGDIHCYGLGSHG